MAELSTELCVPARSHQMPFGAEVTNEGVRFRLWAPKHDRISLKVEDVDDVHLMNALAAGWHEVQVPDAGPGSRYRFILPDGLSVPDPASRFQPEDVHGPSEVIQPHAYKWTDGNWNGRSWHEFVIYELHVGAFTPEGTFQAAICH